MITGKARKRPVTISFVVAEERQVISTLEGGMVAEKGDYIITGVKGERYPCKPDIFEETYDIVVYSDDKEVSDDRREQERDRQDPK